MLGPFVAEESLGGATAWGLIGTAGGIGAVLGDAAALRLRPRRPLLVGGLAASLWALEPAVLARPFPTAVIAVAAALGFGGSGFSNALWFTALQERIPREALSRVSSFDWLGSIAFQPAGFALAGPFAAAIGVPATLLGSAAVQASACIAVVALAERPRASALVSDPLAGAWGAVSARSWSAPPKGGERYDRDARKRRRPAGLIATMQGDTRSPSGALRVSRSGRARAAASCALCRRRRFPSARRARIACSSPAPASLERPASRSTSARSSSTFARRFRASVSSASCVASPIELLGLDEPALPRQDPRPERPPEELREDVVRRTELLGATGSSARPRRSARVRRGRHRAPPPASRGTRDCPCARAPRSLL